MATIRRRPATLDALADEIAYAARYGKQQFPWLTDRFARLAALNRALTRLVQRENTPAKKDDEE